MEHFHLTTPQQNIWNLQKYYEDTAIANLCGAMLFQERKDLKILQKAIRQFIQSQSGIRLRFREEKEAGQYVSEEIVEMIPALTFESEEELDCYAEAFAREPIGLTDQAMYRFVVFHLENENRSGLLVVLSHLISDAWTFGLMAEQIDAAYRSLAGEAGISLVEGDYRDFIQSEEQYLISERYEKDKKYWEEKYDARPETMPVRLCQAPVNTVEARRVTRTIPADLEQNIATYCKNRPVTQAVLFETALILYLSRINPENQTVTVGVPVLNRSSVKEKAIAGMFVSTMPLTVSVSENMEVMELAGQITRGHMNLFRHQKYPYGDILRSLREKQDFSGNLYDVMISYQNARTKTGADTKWYSNGYSEVPLVIHIDNRDGKDCHTLNVDYQTAVFRNEEEIEFLIERLEYILWQIVEEKRKTIGDIEIVPPREYEKVVHEFNDTYVEYPREKCVHELFTEQAAKTPERVALVFEDRKFTYRELDEMSNSLAHFLRGKGVGRGDIVPIIARRSWHVVVAMLGILKAGGAYMPVDPEYPEDRIRYMLSETKAKIVLEYEYKNNGTYKTIDLAEVDYGRNRNQIENCNSANDMCYVLYTSGSAGRPKAVCISHANMANFNNKNNNNHYQRIMPETCGMVLADTEFIFDIAAFEIFLSLLNGLCLVLARDVMDAPHLAGLMEKYHADALHITPTKLLTLLHDRAFQKAIAQVKVLMVGAEVFTESLYQTVSKYTGAVIYNGYGPTETTIGCSFKKVVSELGSGADITIGTPIANTQIYILDDDQRPVPIGVPGELCIAGEGVGLGYLNRPRLTTERFIPNPFAQM